MQQLNRVEFRHFHLYCGLGGGAKGFNKGHARVGNTEATFRCIGGVDSDPAAIADFERASGCKGTVLDLFDRDQYQLWHGKEPPAEWREATPFDIQMAAGGERPNIIFLSAPCKGFSGLLDEQTSKTDKYQALNRLTLRGMWLALEAWQDDPVEFFVFENVPRIMNRGRPLLDQISKLLRRYGYAVAETTHDCGELGGLAQTRYRFLLVARHMEKVPPFLYEPPKRPLRGVGEVLEKLPLPGIENGGPMHRIPSLLWKTWVRLAFVEAGADWRSLKRLRVEDGVLRDYGIVPEGYGHASTLGVTPWDRHVGTVGGRSSPTNGSYAVADPRAQSEFGGKGKYRVTPMDGQAGTVIGASGTGNGAFAVADPRGAKMMAGGLGVRAWDETGRTVIGESYPTNGAHSVADPRVNGHEKSVQLGVRPWDKPAGVVTGKMYVGGGPNSVADPRYNNWKDSAHRNKMRVVPFDGTASTVTGSTQVASGALSVADPRPDWPAYGQLGLNAWDEPTGTITSQRAPGQGKFSVADPRHAGPPKFNNVFRVVRYDDPSPAVTAGMTPTSGGVCVADPRPHGVAKNCEGRYQTQGHYGVVRWADTSKAVTGSGQHDNGYGSVADPRGDGAGIPDGAPALPGPDDALICRIIAEDGTWHRPFTTLELAALQSLIDPEDLTPLHGSSDTAWRERIGNAVPPDSAAAIASVMGETLLLAMAGETFMLSNDPIWVQPLRIAMAVDDRQLAHELEAM
jgi:site-specific DNA-cytosine methylase